MDSKFNIRCHVTQLHDSAVTCSSGRGSISTMDTYTRYTRSQARKLITEPSLSDVSSAGSLQSQVSLNDADIQASTQATSSCKAPTKWTHHDETLLIQFLA